MVTYAGFAQVYDHLMEEAPYDDWIRWVSGLLNMEDSRPDSILDAGCGTGTILLDLLENGYDVQGLDASVDMLHVAEQKIKSRGFTPSFYHEDMRSFRLPKTYDAVISFCDSLNYVIEETDLHRTFTAFYEHLNDGGNLVFDVHSTGYVKEVLQDFSFADAAGDAAYIWNVIPTNREAEVQHDLSLFIHRGGSTYERFDERHLQRTFPISTYCDVLEACGFEICGIYGDFTWNAPQEDADRIFFHAKKAVQNPSPGINL
ncbi:class I SAM-dependent DNA methyltransferase [Salibacterium halotolerans]|uniref:Ubiquinone/menaquinone biosynthesis C-methylase UbiE n=1 Tax=Salibacterium halotolerans TaxID=1884432 RepID=A0A1I5NEB4_9BACI|nr:class I SAM-dependent methyltransferase [Salibacterium halotolerans]SFP20047.1 Ubiquinone/menaquinone biosynthesis C-methylase UbiE [Salibacterium halotolerans]